MPIRFFSEEIDFQLRNSVKVKKWIFESAFREKRPVSDLNFIFCSDDYLLGLNKKYLNHRTLTDIITFEYSDSSVISGEIYISIERVSENARIFKVDFDYELSRVIIHGVLHLCGYKDKSPAHKALMRKKEDAYLSLWKNLFHVKRSK
jgi:rRNA maturation RNase YbeY